MTQTPARPGARGLPAPAELVTLTVDGIEVAVAKDTLVIRAAEQVGVQIPRFCDHPLLAPVGACRQCLVDIPDAGNGRGLPKPQASCTLPVAEGMVVTTQLTSASAEKAQRGVMEFLLINHPLDCPVCDKGGECPLQNQAMSNGLGESRFALSGSGGVKRTFPKPINLSPQVLLDRERCIVCQRCTRFAEQIPGDPFIALVERGSQQQIGIAADRRGDAPGFTSYFAGNAVQICPVGALTSQSYRFRSRPFDLVSTASVAEHDACGSAIRIDHRRGKVMRRLAGDDPEVNEEWITDKDRFAFTYAVAPDRLGHPRIRENGVLRPASWPEAFAVAARGLAAARAGRGVGVLTGGRVTGEDAYAYAKFARVALGTNDIDFRARPHSVEEAEFLAAHVVLHGPESGAVTMADLERATTVVLAGLEPEEEAGAIFLRLRKAVLHHGTRVLGLTSHTTPGLAKLRGTLVPTAPGDEPAALRSLLGHADGAGLGGLDATSVILVGERLAVVPGALTAAAELAAKTGARLAWVPRRAGDRGALEAGCLPGLLPGGRAVADAAARIDAATTWGAPALPQTPGRDGNAIVAALGAGELAGLVIGGVDPDDTADPAAFRAALERADFVVALDLRESEVTAGADVVFPVAPTTDKAGMFVTWEGRVRPFEAVFAQPASLPDLRVLAGIAEELGTALGLRTVAEARAEMAEMGPWDGVRVEMTPVSADESDPGPDPARPDAARRGQRLASWRLLIDRGRLQDGEAHLAACARPVVVVVPPAVHAALGPTITITGDRGAVTVASEAAADMVAGTVWLPVNSFGAGLWADVASPGSRVTLTSGESR